MKFLTVTTFLFIIISVLVLINFFTEKLKNKAIGYIFLAIILFGFVLRILAVIYIPCEPVSDYYTMFSAAKSLANGGNPFTYGSYFQRFPHMTAFPVLCAFLMKVFGTGVYVIKIFNVIFKTFAICAAGLIGRELFDKKGMLSATFLYAVFLPDIFYTPVTATENFALVFLLFSLLFYIKAYKSDTTKETLKNAVFCGVILSFGCLLRGVAPFYLAAYFAGILFVFKGIKNKLLSLAGILVSYILIFQIVSLSLFYSGITEYKLSDKGEPYVVYMLVGSNFETNGMYSSEDHGVYLDAGEDPELASEIATEKLIKRITENKEKIVPLLIKKTDIVWGDASFNSIYWSMYENGMAADNSFAPIAMSLCKTTYHFLIVLTVIAAALYKKWRMSFMLALLPLAFEGGLMLMEIQPRYTFSVAYIFVIFGTVGFCVLFNIIKQKFITKE